MLTATSAPKPVAVTGKEKNDGLTDDLSPSYSPERSRRALIASLSTNFHHPKFPHTRAQLATIAREYRFRNASNAGYSVSLSGPESDAEQDDNNEVGVTPQLVLRVAALLEEEKEEDLKKILRETFVMDDKMLESPILDLMHAHKDDITGVPFLLLTPTRRQISRPSSRASNQSFRLPVGPPRPDTPVNPASAPTSPSLLGPIRRPLTPAASPLATGLGAQCSSPTASPTLAHVTSISFSATSLPASPLSSPRILNAKAHEFRPAPRPLSSASSNPGAASSFIGRRTETPSPDLWAVGSGALRGASKLAIASPLIPDSSLLPPGTPPRSLTPSSPLRITTNVNGNDGDGDDDPFDPFAQTGKIRAPRSFHSLGSPANPSELESSNSTSSASEEGNVYPHTSLTYPSIYGEYHPPEEPNGTSHEDGDAHQHGAGPWIDDAMNLHFDYNPVEYDLDSAALTDGMTPFDVLSSVFGSTLAPSELEEALATNGYDFERAIQWLVDRARPTTSPSQRGQANLHGHYLGAGVHVVPRSQFNYIRGARANFAGTNGRGKFLSGPGRPSAQGGNRVCRYFLAGECMRADCRFSHDLDRALCRFWLRGMCAKGETCEFLHNLPNEAEVQNLASSLTQTDMNESNDQNGASSVQDEFPILSHDTLRGVRRGYEARGTRGIHDPSRTRFAAAVKKAPPNLTGTMPSGTIAAQMAGRREAKAAMGDSVFTKPTVVAPRPSPRLRLRAPLLLPTLPTGETINSLYMSYRARALQLGAARSACLSRAADAWRRSDGAAAKRFSREGHELNVRMNAESAEAASKLVRERAKAAEAAVKARDTNWSTDPADRASRGKVVGGGLGICLGVIGRGAFDDAAKLTQEERTEAVLDLHGLHSNEAADVLEEFLLTLEREHFFGLAFVIVGEEKHTGTQDPLRGASRARLATGIREWLHNWGYPWQERDGIICVDPLTHMQ